MSRIRMAAPRFRFADFCGQLGEDDNVDPREFFDRRKQNRPDRRSGRKALQLCRQVQRALSYALSETHDDKLHELFVESVEPAPNEKRLMVTVSCMGEEFDPIDIITRLQFATPFLRSQVAESIHRKRTPELMFQCLPPKEPTTDNE